jgi:exodeoxyribonuclease V gamma subunit
VLHLSTAGHAGPLAAALAEVLAAAPEDPMTPEWVAVPTMGMRRWLALELARCLGASGPGAVDGVAANIEFSSPGQLRQALLEAGRTGDPDPWHVDSLVWAVLEVLRSRDRDDRLGPLTRLPPGATWFSRARRLADVFDRYSVRRPELVLNWVAGRDVDGAGRPLLEHDRWQPHLWRLVRDGIGVPSPPERLPELLEAVRTGALDLELPRRLAVFGITTLPSGAPFIELLEAVAALRELHLLLLDPSPVTTSRVRHAVLASPRPLTQLRSDDLSDAEVSQVSHPLLRSWGRPYRERSVLLAAAESRGVPAPEPVEKSRGEDAETAKTLLLRLQHDLREGGAPAGDFELDPADRSVQVHSCHGQARQVQVLRDAILHLLEDDPSLREDDIVVLSPAIDQFAPLVQAGFGTRVEDADGPSGDGTPRLSYRITDRSLRESSPALAALDSLLALVAGRFSASEVLEFISLPVVQRRFNLDDDSLRTISAWVAEANVRWGLDGPQREPWGLPAEFTSNSWRSALDRVLMGVAVSDDGVGLAPGGIAPLGVDSGDIAVAGRLADLVGALQAVADDFKQDRSAAAWCEALAEAIAQFFDVEDAQQWQLEQMRRLVAKVGDQAIVGGEPATVELSLPDVRRLLADRLQGAPRRSEFFRGGITVSSLTPLRWLPFRVICLLGLDEVGTSGSGAVDGDDLAATSPLVGDGDPRSEVRQALLEAVLAARDHLVITRTGHDLRTNREVPATTVLAELRDTITSTLAPAHEGDYARLIETVHPCQRFDDRCFSRGELNVPGPFSFDAGAFAGAVARGKRTAVNRPFLEGVLPVAANTESVISLAELKRFFNHPIKAFLRQGLQLHLLGEDADASDDLVTSLGGLEHWAVADRLLAARFSGHSTAEWERHERALGTLPPGSLGQAVLSEVTQAIDGVLSVAQGLNVDPARDDRLLIEVELRDGTRVVSTIVGRCADLSPGPALLTCSRVDPKRRLAAWLDLVALVATEPTTNWRSVVVGKPEKGDGVASLGLVSRGETPADRRRLAVAALEVAVDLYRRGMREPIPLFATLSYKLHNQTARPGDWLPFGGHGDGHDGANRLVFGDIQYGELRAIPVRDDDPPGSATGRALRFANYLWAAVNASAEETT